MKKKEGGKDTVDAGVWKVLHSSLVPGMLPPSPPAVADYYLCR